MLEKEKNGVKRRRENAKLKDDLSQKLTGKLYHYLKDVKKAAKKAKAFEMQKLVKKLKVLRDKSPQSGEIVDLDAQLEILKKTDHEAFANTALKKKIQKDKFLSTNPQMNAVVTAELVTNLVQPAEPGSHLAKVQGRLLSSKVLAAEVSIVIGVLRLTVQPELKKSEQSEGGDNEGLDEEMGRPPSKRQKVAEEADEAEDENEGEGSELRRIIISEDDEDVDDGGWESGSVDGGDEVEDGSPDETDEEENTGEEQEQDEPLKTSESAKPKQPKPAPAKGKSAAESTFLPSLAVGFTLGDSDASDWSDSEAKIADGVKKNRRGQRARRAIWEKKYGKNANHVKKQQDLAGKDDRSRGKRWPDKTHRNDRPWDKPRPEGAYNSTTVSRPVRPPTATAPIDRERRKEDKPLHPSWEAKRKLKEKQNPSIVPAQGKKIVF